MENKKMVLERSDQKAIEFVKKTVNKFKLQTIEKNIDLKFDVDANDIPGLIGQESTLAPNDIQTSLLSFVENHNFISIDVPKMTQVISNLISNALKFTDEGKKVVVKLRKSTEILQPSDLRDPSFKQTGNELPNHSRFMIIWASFTSVYKFFRDCLFRRRPKNIFEPVSESDLENNILPGISEIGERLCIGTLILSVIDGGVGMKSDDLQQLFKDIVQFNPGKLQAGGGSGLGMMITKGIVDLHGGVISVHSDGIGHGSTFTVKIPLYEGDKYSYPESYKSNSLRDPKLIISNTEIGTDGDQSESKIVDLDQSEDLKVHFLIVDDSRLNRKMLSKLLKSEIGFTCEEADDGDTALEIMMNVEKRGKIDVILMDFMMPKMDGPTATEAIRALGYNGIIYGVTGNVLEEDIQTFLASGVDRVFVKPLDLDEMKDSIKRHFENKMAVDMRNMEVGGSGMSYSIK